MELRSLSRIREAPYPKPEPLIDGLLNKGELAIVTGQWDSFKSRFSTELAHSIATGEKFLSHFDTVGTGGALIIQKEINPAFFDERIIQLMDGHADSVPIYVWPYEDDLRFGDGFEELLDEVIEEYNLSLVVFDPLAYFWPLDKGFDENSATDVTAAISPILRLRSSGCSFILVHHDPKPSVSGQSHARGSSVLVNAPDVRFLLHREQDEDALTIRAKTRNIRAPSKIKAYLDDRGRLYYNQKGKKVIDLSDYDMVIFLHKDGKTSREIAMMLNLSVDMVEMMVEKYDKNRQKGT